MVTLMFLTMLFGATLASLPAIILLSSMLYVFFVMYLWEAISACILQKKLAISKGLINFIPGIRGLNEGKILICLLGQPEKNGKYLAGSLIARMIYAIDIFGTYYVILSNYRSDRFSLFEFTNAISRAFTSPVFSKLWPIIVISFIAAYIVLTVLRTKAMKAVGYFGIVAAIIAIFFAPFWSIIMVIYLSTFGKEHMPESCYA